MALACKTFRALEFSSSSYEKTSSFNLSSWPLSQVAPLSSPCKHLQRSHRIISIACAGRETLVSESQEAVPSSSRANPPGTSLSFQDAAPGNLEVDSHGFLQSDEGSGNGFPQAAVSLEDGSLSPSMQVSQDSTQVSLKEDQRVGLQVHDDDEEEWMKGFPGAKGALIKPLTSDSLKFFPEGYLDTVTTIDKWDWVTVVPTPMLPEGDRLVLQHNRESVILFWYKGRIYALENRSPAAPMFEEGFAKAVISEDGLITCPITESKFDIRTGAAVEWFPKSSFLEKLLTPVLNDLSVYKVKASPGHIFIEKKRLLVGGYYPLAEFTGNKVWTGPDYEEPIIFDDLEFGFTDENELTNGRFAMLGFLSLLILEMTTGEGILKGSGILDFLYKFLPGFPILRY